MSEGGRAFAPAKVNLFLHVSAPAPDGFHPLSSWMVFADLGDRVTLAPADRLELVVGGPFGAELAGEDPQQNLVWRAVQALMGAVRRPLPPFRLGLEKHLPVAAGLGGGSSDAGAALRLIRRELGLALDDAALEALAAGLGSDGPACLWGRPAIGEGRGDRLRPAPRLAPVDAVLANPRTPCPTGAIYRAYDAAGAPGSAEAPPLPEALDGAPELAAVLSLTRNDLEPPARALVPEVADVLDVLAGEPECLFARMTGSGATCFALCGSDIEAAALADRVAALRPGWWVRPCRLGGPWED